MERHELRVAIARPLAGALVPASHLEEDPRVSALRVEGNRRLSMDERTGAKAPGFARIHDVLSARIAALGSTHASPHPAAE